MKNKMIMPTHWGEFREGQDFNCRDGDELPLISRHAEATSWRRCSKNVSGFSALQRPRRKILRSPARAEESRRDGKERRSDFAYSRHSLTSISDWAKFPAYKKLQSGIGGWRVMRDTTFRRVEI
jgi:hypothetical protein